MILYFIKKSIVTICLNLSILLIGFFSYEHIANEFIPAIEVPAVGVVFPTTFLHHNQVKAGLIEPVEKRLLATGDVEKIETTLDKDRAVLFIFYDWDIPPEECLQRARQVVSSVARPEGVLEPIFVLHRPTMSPIYRVAFSGKSIGELTGSIQALAADVERTPGVSGVGLTGGAPEKGRIQLDALKAASRGVKVKEVLGSAYNTWSFRHFWNGESRGEKDLVVRYPMTSLEDLEQVPVYTDSGETVPLKWMARVESYNEEASVLYGAGDDALILEVLKAPGSDALGIVDAVSAKIAALEKAQPELKSTVIYNEAEKIKQAQAGVFQNFAIGVTLNSLILVIFLGSIIGAVVASCVFPTAILGTLYIMNVSGISLNIFALNGFSLASGMITDASIVVLESIMRRFQKGEEIVSACNRGTKDVLIGVFASTLTTAAVIIPISMQTGVSSKLFSDLGITLVATQFVCLIAVFTFVPWLCSKVLSENEYRPAPIDYFFKWSSVLVDGMSALGRKTLVGSVNSRWIRFGIPSAITAVSLSMLVLMPNSEFLPNVAANTYSIAIPYERMDLISKGQELKKKLAKVLGEKDFIEWVITYSDDDTIQATIQLRDTSVVESLVDEIHQTMNVPRGRVIALPLGPTPPSEPMNYDGYYYLRSDMDPEKREKLISAFCGQKEILDCSTSLHYSEPRWTLKNRPMEMLRASSNILETTLDVASLTKNLDIASIANLPLSFPVHLKISNLQEITSFPLLLGKKRDDIGKLHMGFDHRLGEGKNALFRKNSVDYEPLYFRIQGVTIGQAVWDFHLMAEDMGISDFNLMPMGTIETMNETFEKMIGALVLSAFLILLVLVIQFQSLTQALIIMFSMPLSLGGAIVGLLIMGETLNVGVIVGFILLIGIIVNNGILLMDAINQRVASGLSIMDAVLEGVESRTRPILMTTFSTVFGMLPTLVLEAEGKELYQGMAIVNVFGMIFGTFLTLVVTPIIIRFFMELSNKSEGKVSP